jgi:hypothetical protein
MGCHWMTDTSVISSQPKHKSFVENSWLWMGESVNCICNHRVEQHCTIRDQSDHVITIHCHGTSDDGMHCNCKLFTPYSIRIDSCYFNSNDNVTLAGDTEYV